MASGSHFFPRSKFNDETGRSPCAYRHIGVGRRVQTDREADHGEGYRGREKGAGEEASFFFFAFDDADDDFEFFFFLNDPFLALSLSTQNGSL